MASKEVEVQGPQKAGFKGKAVAFRKYLYNPRDKTVLERTCTSWAKIGLFYLIFYSCLAGFFAANLVAFFTIIPDHEPRLQNWDSLIKYNPGMGYRPQTLVDFTLIEFNQGEEDTYIEYVDNLKTYLDAYTDAKQEENELMACDPDNHMTESAKEVNSCKYPIHLLGDECTADKHFGYDDGRPCVLLKMNKLFNWQPEPFSNDSVPENLKGRYNSRYVGITCEGVTDADRDNIGEITFWPEYGFDTSYFPYKNQKNYLQPLVMVQFKRLRSGTLVQVWCKAWADNIYHDKNDRAGSVHFEIIVD